MNVKKSTVYLAVTLLGAVIVNVILLLAYVALSALLLQWNSGDMRMRVRANVAVAKTVSESEMSEKAHAVQEALATARTSAQRQAKWLIVLSPGTWLTQKISNIFTRRHHPAQVWYEGEYVGEFSNTSIEIEGTVYLGPAMPPFPKRQPGDARVRKPLVVSAEDALLWLSHPGFFEPEAIEGVNPRVVKAKAHLLEQFKSGKIKRRLSPEQIVAICLRESQFWKKEDPNGFYIDLNCLGDTDYVGDEKAHGPIQISLRAHASVSAIKGFGLRSTDFLGDLALSEMVYQAWIDEHLPEQDTPELTFEWAARYWNGGPTGSLGKYYNKALRYWNGTSERAGVKGFFANVTQLPIYTELVAFRKTGGVLQVVHTEDSALASAVKDSKGTMLPMWWRHSYYGTVLTESQQSVEASLFPDGRIDWARAQFGAPDAQHLVSSQ